MVPRFKDFSDERCVSFGVVTLNYLIQILEFNVIHESKKKITYKALYNIIGVVIVEPKNFSRPSPAYVVSGKNSRAPSPSNVISFNSAHFL